VREREGERRQDWAAWAEREGGPHGEKKERGGEKRGVLWAERGKERGFGLFFSNPFKQLFKTFLNQTLLHLFHNFFP
jgi:hypothetical protein